MIEEALRHMLRDADKIRERLVEQETREAPLGPVRTVELSDDAAASFTPRAATGAILILRLDGAAPDAGWLLASYGTSTPATVKFEGDAQYVVSTGVLAGTTGMDGNFTCSVHTDGMIYLENRLGAAVTVAYLLMG